ncbi:MAG: hypothetical protein GX308_02380 [Epulopiscium sp.]|nr:hypothetical protein [Candidatus Epulonipiscium sp.]
MIFYLIGGIISFITVFFWKPLIIEFLLKYNIKVNNYNQKEIPLGTGILLLLAITIATFFLIFFSDEPIMYFVYLFGLSFIGFAGIIDDFVKESKIKGLRSHLIRMYQGELTSGGLKALIGGLAALYISFSFSTNLFDLIANIMLILFSINSMNLFDVRPGRALKIFLGVGTILWIFSKAPDRFLTLLGIGGVLPILKGDLREEHMLGDVGANILGYTIGFTEAITLSIRFKMVMVVLLILLHIIAEITSITTIIKKVPFLRYIDDLGRAEK